MWGHLLAAVGNGGQARGRRLGIPGLFQGVMDRQGDMGEPQSGLSVHPSRVDRLLAVL